MYFLDWLKVNKLDRNFNDEDNNNYAVQDDEIEGLHCITFSYLKYFLDIVNVINAGQKLINQSDKVLKDIDTVVIDNMEESNEADAKIKLGPVGHVALRHIINIRQCCEDECSPLTHVDACWIQEQIDCLYNWCTSERNTKNVVELVLNDDNAFFALLKKYAVCYQGVRSLLKRYDHICLSHKLKKI